MIELIDGNILYVDVEAVVNPVNCVGVMGRGLALQFKEMFPETSKLTQRPARAEKFGQDRSLCSKGSPRRIPNTSSIFRRNATGGIEA